MEYKKLAMGKLNGINMLNPSHILDHTSTSELLI